MVNNRSNPPEAGEISTALKSNGLVSDGIGGKGGNVEFGGEGKGIRK
jgi:hypothetical protein